MPQFTPSPPFVRAHTHHLKAAFLVCGAHVGWHDRIRRDPGWSETEFSRGSLGVYLFALLGVASVGFCKDDVK